MSSLISLLPIAAIAVVGTLVVWGNPARLVNRVFFSFSLHAGFWLFCVHLAVVSQENLRWVRLASALGACITPHMWLLKEAILCRDGLFVSLGRRIYFWFGSAVVLIALCYTPWYVRDALPGATAPRFGPAYAVNTVSILALYLALWIETRRQIRRLVGVNRLELQILLLGGTVTAFAVLVLMALRVVLGAVWPIEWQAFVVSVLWLATVISTTTHRVLEAREIVLLIAQKGALALLAGVTTIAVYWSMAECQVPAYLGVLVTVTAAMFVVSIAGERIRQRFRYYPQITAARQAAIVAAQTETRIEGLEQAFRHILAGWARTERIVLFSQLRQARSEHVSVPRVVVDSMRQMKWVTPERLTRERTSPNRLALGEFLAHQQLGLLVCAEGPGLTTLLGFGPNATRLPYTYPAAAQLLELASVMGNALERAHYSHKVQQGEKLATVGLLGASVAHEIRNPLMTIKSIVQLLPAHCDDEQFRKKFFRLISDEVTRIDRLTEQLLDLTSPRAYVTTRVELHEIVRATLDMVAPKAAQKDVVIVEQLAEGPAEVLTDTAAAKQVLLNLCFNAIQALETVEDKERQIRVITRRLERSVELVVADNGPGIAPEIRARLFEPFQTTKATGFGLGLAVCCDILGRLNATISVDPAQPGGGATFRVNFPCQSLSS